MLFSRSGRAEDFKATKVCQMIIVTADAIRRNLKIVSS